MQRTTKICISIVAAATLVVVCVGLSREIKSSRNQKFLEQNKQMLEASIDRELPKGTPYLKVLEFLDSHGIDHSSLEKTFSSGMNVIEAQTRDKIEGAKYSCTIHLVFSFDDSRLLTKYSDKFSCYGP